MKASEFFELPDSLAAFAPHFSSEVAPWEWVRQIALALEEFAFEAPHGVGGGGALTIEGLVRIHPTVVLPPYATILGPAYIGAHTEIRPGAFIRGNVIIGEHCVIGHGAEIKNALLMDRVEVPHRPYISDSVLGSGAHLAAGVVLSNLRLDRQPVVIRMPAQDYPTGLRKFGAILGEAAEVGCNAVLQPGTVLGRRAVVLPGLAFGGYLPAETLARDKSPVAHLPRRF